MNRITRTLTLAAAVAASIGAGTGQAHAGEHVVVILDVTGSMTLSSIPGMTRLDVAKERISTFLDTVPGTPTEYSLWFFEGSGYTPIYDFADHATAAQVKAAVLAATTGGVTPLAQTVCAAVDELVNYLPSEYHTKRIYLATDGEENASIGECAGPSSATLYPNLTSGSWQWKVRNMACTNDPDLPGLCAGGVPPGGITLIIDIDHLFDFIPIMSAAQSAAREALPGDRITLQASAPRVANADAAFFAGLASETHGRYAGITPTTPPNQAVPQPGDATLDGCVNIQDRALVLQQWGTPGNGKTDFNRDGIVNMFDLLTVLQNFGSGCTP